MKHYYKQDKDLFRVELITITAGVAVIRRRGETYVCLPENLVSVPDDFEVVL